jgi:hypothetical protein
LPALIARIRHLEDQVREWRSLRDGEIQDKRRDRAAARALYLDSYEEMRRRHAEEARAELDRIDAEIAERKAVRESIRRSADWNNYD